jgi:gliding motility-associated-like protein
MVIALFTSFSFGQSVTPLKTTTNSTTNCGVIDIELKITGADPASRNADVVLVIDVSGSMNDVIPNDTKKSMQYAKDAAKSFIDAAASNPNNRIALVSYTTNARLEIGLTYLDATGITSLKNKIDILTAKEYTNIQDGIVKASDELNSNGRFDCSTARSIILLTDGITNRTGVSGSTTNCRNVEKTSTCVTSAIAAATAAKTTTKFSVDYYNQIFAIGLLGGVPGDINTNNSNRDIAKFTLDGIQGGANQATIAYNGTDLASIYSNIASQITWVAQNLSEKETVPTGYTISNITATKGTATQSGQDINWSVNFLNSETITLNYQLTPPSSVCGNQTVSTSLLNYTNSSCSSATLNIPTPNTNILCPTITLNSKVDVSCFGGNNGAIILNEATGGIGPYTYDWSDISGTDNSKNRTNLTPGIYTVIANDKNGCSTSALTVTIGQPLAILSASAIITNNNNCTNCNNGAINLTVSGGTEPYSFIWSNGAITKDISNLSSGTYSVEIKDKNGCIANYSFVISESSISITKDGTYVDSNKDGITNVGDVVTYNFVITNTGNVPLTNVTVTDNNAVITGGPIALLGVGATDSTTFSGSHTITQQDIITGYVYNLAIVMAKDPNDKAVTDTSSDPTPCITCPIDTNCPDCTITVLDKNKINAVDDTAGPINGLNGATNILNVFDNDTLNTIAVNPADVTLSIVTPDPTGYMTMNPNGSIDLKDGTPAGTYTLVYQICENANIENCDSATVTITVICNDINKIAGIVFNAGTNTPLANVPVTLIPQGTTTGPILIRITNSNGYYNFTGMASGNYLVQVQDANLNSANQLYPVNSSLFFTTIENCKYQIHDFGYDKSDLPVLGDFVWYDINNNGIQDEWFDANNDNLVTQNIPDANGTFDYSKWEWIDLNGDGSYKGSQNVGELNAAGFGNSKSANLFVTGPNNYSDSVIIGIQGFWRNRPTIGVYGDYTVQLKMDANLEAQASTMGATGLVKVLSNSNKTATKTNKQAGFEVCGPTDQNPQNATITATDQVHLDLDFGISCKKFANIQATNDTYSVTQCSVLSEIRNALNNDLLDGVTTTNLNLFKFKLLTNLAQNIDINSTGNISLIDGLAAGQYTFDYQVCEAANPTNCSSATITINVAGIEAVTISSTACNDDSTPIDLNKLLPQGVPTNGTWIDTENTGGLTGNNLNVVGIPLNNYKYEYKIGGNCPRSVFVDMEINDDCKVLPCKTIKVHNAISANEDGKNDYFQIDNIENNDCYKNFKVKIYNRWGVLVFENDNYNNESNAFRGQSEGRTTINKNEGLPTGTYFYVLNYDSVDGLGMTQNIRSDGYLYLVK